MPIPTELRQPGSRVSYQDQANPRRIGEIIEIEDGDQYKVRWDDEEEPREAISDLRQHGWSLVAELPGSPFDGADIISIYTRSMAIEDGSLVDVSEMAKEAGFTIPVALTRAAWSDCVEWGEEREIHQDESGRLWDVLWMTRCQVRGSAGSEVIVRLWRIPNRDGALPSGEEIKLRALCGPGDAGEPVITIMLPDED